MSLSLQLSIREKMNAEFPAASSLPMFIQFLSSSFTGFILCSQRLFDISAAPSLRIFFKDFHWFIVYEFGILHHHDHLMMDTFKNRSRKLKSFFLNLLTAEFHCAEQVFISEHITDRVYYIHRSSV